MNKWYFSVFTTGLAMILLSLLANQTELRRGELACRLGLDQPALGNWIVLLNVFLTCVFAVLVNRMTAASDLDDQEKRREEELGKLRVRLKEFQHSHHYQADIVQLDSAYDFFREESEIIILDSHRDLFLQFPGKPHTYRQDLMSLVPDFVIRPPSYLEFGSSLKDFSNSVELDNFGKLLEECRQSSAATFVNVAKTNYRKFYNAEKFGVLSYASTRHHLSEKPINTLTLYRTDYFAHVTARHMVRRLKESGWAFGMAHWGDVINKFPFLFTSIGVNCFVLTQESGGQHALLLLRRSANSPNRHYHHQWHVSLNEGFSVMDVEPDTGKPSLHRCVVRGMLEELGVESHTIVSQGFFDIFLVKEVLELGIAGLVTLRLNSKELAQRLQGSANFSLECEDNWAFVAYHRTDIERFLTDPQNMMTKACRYCLGAILARGCPVP